MVAATSLVVASCGLFEVDSSSITAMAGTFRADRAQLGQYFSFQRYSAGSDVELGGPNRQVLDEIFQDGAADPTAWQPFVEAPESLWPEQRTVEVASVEATYQQPDTSGATLLHGDFDLAAVEIQLDSVLKEFGADLENAQGDPGPAPKLVTKQDGSFTVLSVDGMAPTRLVIGLNATLAVSDDRMLALAAGTSPSSALVEDRDKSRLALEANRQVAGALDEVDAYAAVLSFEPVSFDDGEPATAGGFGTAIVDGDETSYTVLAHDADVAAADNAKTLVPLMRQEAECIEPPEADVRGTVVVASCRTDGAKWASTVRDGFDESGPFAFE